jgi:hypothetical protein
MSEAISGNPELPIEQQLATLDLSLGAGRKPQTSNGHSIARQEPSLRPSDDPIRFNAYYGARPRPKAARDWKPSLRTKNRFTAHIYGFPLSCKRLISIHCGTISFIFNGQVFFCAFQSS